MPTPSLDTLLHLAPVAIAVGYLACYAFACWQFPFSHCRRCHGRGRLTTKTGRRGRVCPRCDGGRRRIHLGRRLFEYVAREYRTGNTRLPTASGTGGATTRATA